MVNALMVTDALERAFKAFHLDARNGEHWHRLAGILAEKQFGKKAKKTGRPVEWTIDREYQLALDAREIEKENNGPRYTSRKLAQLIYDKFPGRYGVERSKTPEPWREIYVHILDMRRRYEEKV